MYTCTVSTHSFRYVVQDLQDGLLFGICHVPEDDGAIGEEEDVASENSFVVLIDGAGVEQLLLQLLVQSQRLVKAFFLERRVRRGER